MADAIRSGFLGDVPHGFSTREGLAPDALLPGAPRLFAEQVHSSDAITVERPWEPGERPRGDGLVTGRPGLVLAIVTADCAPVLLCDRQAGVVAAAHAGWRGAHEGIVESTVAAMGRLGARPARIVAAIGPCIAQPSYEVDQAFRDRFASEDAAFFVAGRAEHWQFDLPGYVASRLRAAGITTIDLIAEDTYANPGRYHSYRRAMHRGEANDGRQISAIGLSGS